MGNSGSGAGGGGGGGGGGGFGGGGFGGGGGGGSGSVTLRGGALTSTDPGRAAAFTAIAKIYSRLMPDYLSFLFSDPGVASAYEAMFHLHVALVADKSWDTVEAKYGVDPGPGCLPRLAAALTNDAAATPSLQATLKAAVLDFLLRAVGDDFAIRNRGDASQVIAAASERVFARTANHFLGSFLAENLRLEGKNLGKEARLLVDDYASAKADAIVDAFAGKFRHTAWRDINQVSYPHLIRVMSGEADWTVKRLRAELKP